MANKDTHAIKDTLYPLVSEALKKPATVKAYMKYVNEFFSKRDTDLYDSLPCSRLICGEEEMDSLFKVLGIDKSQAQMAIAQTYYASISNFNPKAALHAFTVTQLSVIRYFLLNNKKEKDISILLLAFSGKFYPSLHYRSYPTVVPVRHVMEYVVNNKLSQKYDLASKGSIIGAVQSITETWVSTYKSRFKSFNDDDAVYLIQQLHSRIGSFMKNIATEYYKAYEDKDIYMTYSSDSFDQDNYHITDNDSLKVEKLTEATVNYIISNGVDYKIAVSCADNNITPNECKAIIESIILTKENILSIKELISLMISSYFAISDTKDVTDIKFISYTMAPKPNAKQPEIIRQKEIVETFLMNSGTAYVRRKSRDGTRNSYERCVKMYFVLCIHNAARKA